MSLAACANCQQAAAQRWWGGYSMGCVACCARLVRSARPLRHAQEAHFHAIGRRAGRPEKEAVIQQIRLQDESAKNGRKK